jgi:hypothetical protein
MYLYTDRSGSETRRLGQPESLPGLGGPPIPRLCCMLRPNFFIGLSSLGAHQGPNEGNGEIYTGGAGFIDTAHVRHCCDVTKWAYDQITALNGQPGRVATPEGAATLTQAIPQNMWTKVARDISFDDALGHEIWTYWKPGPGLGNSAFSPEDLCSNHLGTYIAEAAINIPAPGGGANFAASVTAVLKATLTILKAQPITETQNAWNRVQNCWMSIGGWPTHYMTLKRRNFTITPWKAGHASDVPTPAWVTQGRGAGARYYTFKYSATLMNIETATFKARIGDIQTDALKRYGPKYDQQTCP